MDPIGDMELAAELRVSEMRKEKAMKWLPVDYEKFVSELIGDKLAYMIEFLYTRS